MDSESEEEGRRLTVLGQFATVATASSAVGLVAAACGVSTSKSAATTIVLIGLVYLWLYRHRIDRRVRSSRVLSVVGVATIAALVTSHHLASAVVGWTISRSTGIVEHVPIANDFLPRLPSYIERSREDVWFAGMSFYITLPANKDAVLDALKRGVNVRFLIFDPTAANVDEIAAGFSQTTEELKSESAVTISNLRAILNAAEATNTPGKIEVRFFRSVPKMRLYVIDRDSEDGYTFFIPHVEHQNTPNSPGLLARNVRTGIAPALIEGLARAWSKSEPWEDAYPRIVVALGRS